MVIILGDVLIYLVLEISLEPIGATILTLPIGGRGRQQT